MTEEVYLAVDLGAGSGRVMAGEFDGQRIQLNEVHRFPTVSVNFGHSTHWDVTALYASILEGLKLAWQRYGDKIQSLGVDTWGVDYGLIDERGLLIGMPFQYRDARTEGMDTAAFEAIGRETIFNETGIQFLSFNTIYQLYSEVKTNSPWLQIADRLLFMPDLFIYWLTGQKIHERTMASTSQFLNPTTGTWSKAIFDGLQFPEAIFGDLTEPGTTIGKLQSHICEDLNIGAIEVVAVGGHDTASAVAGTPISGPDAAFLSSGTWSLMGIESDQPIINEASLEDNFSNEVGVAGKVRFLKNICGLWLIQQCREQWAREGDEIDFDTIVKLASEADKFKSFIDPDHHWFARAGDMPEQIRKYCKASHQFVPESKGEVLAVAFQSLAAKYKIIFDKLSHFASSPLKQLNAGGGGIQNRLLNQYAADALQCEVVTGPVEATSMGNIITQMMGLGKIASLAEGRSIIAESCEQETFTPNTEDAEKWNIAVDKLRALIESKPDSLA